MMGHLHVMMGHLHVMMGHLHVMMGHLHVMMGHLHAIVNLIFKAANDVPQFVTISRGDAIVVHGEELDHLVIGVDAHMESAQEICDHFRTRPAHSVNPLRRELLGNP
jgi:hypothetical protein